MPASFVEKLKKAVSPDRVLSDGASRLLYSYDGALDKNLPGSIVLPRSTEEVAAVVRAARAAGVPYVARGAGTNLCGASVPSAGGLVVHLAGMNRILSVDQDRRRARVEPGVVNLHLNKALAGRGLFYAPDPASQKACTIGGNVGTNAGGPHCLKYGVTTHHVTGLKVVLPDGSVIDTSIDNPGYDLTALLVGAEGTLGIVTEVEVNLLPVPERVETMLASFPSLEAAAQTVTDIMAAGIVPATLEFLDRLTLVAVEAFVHAGYPTDAEAVLLIETDGAAAAAREDMARAEALCKKNGGGDFRRARDEAERQKLWEGRRGAYPAMAKLAPNVLVEDGVVPRTKLPEAVRRIRAIAAREKISTMGLIAHAGDGNLHPNIAFDERDRAQTERVRAAGHEMMHVCVDLGGSISGEHGIGTDKRAAMGWLFDGPTLNLFRRVKQALDPDDLCNPGKMVPAPGAGTPAPAAPDRAGLRHDAENFTVAAGADVAVAKLKEVLAAAGQHVALAGTGTVGEAVAAGAPGLRDHVMAVRAALPGGVVSVGAPVMKSVAGYDLAKLFLGARGTLGDVQEATFKTLPFAADTCPVKSVSPAFDDPLSTLVRRAFHGG